MSLFNQLIRLEQMAGLIFLLSMPRLPRRIWRSRELTRLDTMEFCQYLRIVQAHFRNHLYLVLILSPATLQGISSLCLHFYISIITQWNLCLMELWSNGQFGYVMKLVLSMNQSLAVPCQLVTLIRLAHQLRELIIFYPAHHISKWLPLVQLILDIIQELYGIRVHLDPNISSIRLGQLMDMIILSLYFILIKMPPCINVHLQTGKDYQLKFMPIAMLQNRLVCSHIWIDLLLGPYLVSLSLSCPLFKRTIWFISQSKFLLLFTNPLMFLLQNRQYAMSLANNCQGAHGIYIKHMLMPLRALEAELFLITLVLMIILATLLPIFFLRSEQQECLVSSINFTSPLMITSGSVFQKVFKGKPLSVAKPLKSDKKIPFDKIIVADIEALIYSDGRNEPYMIAWYNGHDYMEFRVDSYDMSQEAMFYDFWLNIIRSNPTSICYLHNWAGYDSILSLDSLLKVCVMLNCEVSPVMRNSEIISLTIVNLELKIRFMIKDSIKIIPSALARIAKDFKLEISKDHFPHYFNPLEELGILDYVGEIPPYEKYEIKRTTKAEYEQLKADLKGRPWSFMKVSSTYLRADCLVLYDALRLFMKQISKVCALNPLLNLTAPGIAYKMFKLEALPRLEKTGRKLYDLSSWNDAYLRSFYHGGIVDVYNPVFKGEGYHYDVNSLYPAAMLKDFPVGPPAWRMISVYEFLNSKAFGFVEALVLSPDNEAGWIGLLPVKREGRLICPAGIIHGFWLSEELRFAIEHGYKLLKIYNFIEFERYSGLFNELIYKLNEIKINSQLAGNAVMRNVAKLLMNSMYGRFGIHNDFLKHKLVLNSEITEFLKDHAIADIIPLSGFSMVGYMGRHRTVDLTREFGLESYDYFQEVESEFGIGNNVPIAATVTTYSRMIINSYKLKALSLGYELYYSDTDSLMISGPLPNEDISKTELGKMKLEHKFSEGYFLMPKVYYMNCENEQVFKCKGYPGELTALDYEKLYQGETLNLLVTKWFKDRWKGQILIKHGLPYNLRVVFNKRNRIFENNIWKTTSPLVLNDSY